METKQKQSRRIRFNIIDFLLISVILFCGIMLYLMIKQPYNAEGTAETPTVLCELSISVPKMREEFRGKINIGDKVWNPETGTVLGEVTDVSYGVAEYEGINPTTGQVVTSSYPGYLSATITVRGTAENDGGFCKIGEETVLTGNELPIRLPGLYVLGTIRTLTFGEEITNG